MHNILLGVTGSVAAIKTQKLVNQLRLLGNVRIVATKAGDYFINQGCGNPKDLFSSDYFIDQDEWTEKYQLGDPVLHIELRKWASCLVLAPLDANTLAKSVHGLCDNLLTCVIRAWDWFKPVFVAPAMNTHMYNHFLTDEQLKKLEEWGATVIPPQSKKLACGDVGVGAMADIDTIVSMVNAKLRWKFPLENCNGIPLNHHPGAFGFHRKKNHHTGVDLYTNDGEPVYAVEDGIVVKVDVFTGPKLGHDWWEETYGVMVEGASGVVNYGEVTPQVYLNQKVSRGMCIGKVKRVLFPDRYRADIPGHSCSMLHFELYKHGSREFADWHDPQKNPDLLDPTRYLLDAENNPRKTLTWENSENRTVG